MCMRQRVAFIVGLAFWFPLLRGEFFASHFLWPGQGPFSPLIYNLFVVLTACGVLVAHRPLERLVKERPEVVALCAVIAGGLLLPFALGAPSPLCTAAAMAATALAFCLLLAAWGMVCMAVHPASTTGVRTALLDTAIAYALSYFSLLPGLGGTMPGALRCLCMIGSGITFWVAMTTGTLGTTAPTPPKNASLHNLLPRPTAWLIAMYLAVELISAVLVGIFVPAYHPGSADPFRSQLSLGLACAIMALLLPYKRPVPTVATLCVGMAVILVGSLLFMPDIEPLALLGSHVLTAGRRLFWTLFFMLLITACAETPLRPSVAFGALFPLTFMATRIPVNALRIADPAQTMSASSIYMVSLALSLLLIACALVLVWLEAVGSRGGRPSPVATAYLDQDSIRFAVSQELAKAHALTERERAALELLSRGYTVKRVADELYVSQNTVRAHAKAIYRKVGCHSKQELVDLVEKNMEQAARSQIPSIR